MPRHGLLFDMTLTLLKVSPINTALNSSILHSPLCLFPLRIIITEAFSIVCFKFFTEVRYFLFVVVFFFLFVQTSLGILFFEWLSVNPER